MKIEERIEKMKEEVDNFNKEMESIKVNKWIF